MMACFRRSYLRTSAKDGPAALGLRCSSFFFLLEWRIVSDLDVAAIAIASPSDFVPNGGKGSHDRSTIIDNASGLDHVSMIFCGLEQKYDHVQLAREAHGEHRSDLCE
jgi:hypothetical protein